MKKVLTLLFSVCMTLMAWSQTLTVTGVVVDVYDKEPLPGVSVMIKDQFQTAVMTDIDGNFAIKAPKGAELVFTFIDYNPTTVKVVSDAPLSVDMTRKSLMLDEVVAIGYGVQKKRYHWCDFVDIEQRYRTYTGIQPDTGASGACFRCAGDAEYRCSRSRFYDKNTWYWNCQ